MRLDVSWRAVSFALAACPAVVIAAFMRVHVPSLVVGNRGREPVPRLLRRPAFVAALVAIALAGATEQGMGQWLPAFAERSKGCTKTTASLVFAGFLVVMVIGRVLGALIGRRVRPTVLLLVSCALCTVLFAAGCFVPSVPVSLAACVAIGLTVSCLWPTMIGLTADRFPAGGASMFGLLAAFGNAGCFAMPWLVGVTAEQTGRLDWALAAAGVCPVLMAAAVVWMVTRVPHEGATGDGAPTH